MPHRQRKSTRMRDHIRDVEAAALRMGALLVHIRPLVPSMPREMAAQVGEAINDYKALEQAQARRAEQQKANQ